MGFEDSFYERCIGCMDCATKTDRGFNPICNILEMSFRLFGLKRGRMLMLFVEFVGSSIKQKERTYIFSAYLLFLCTYKQQALCKYKQIDPNPFHANLILLMILLISAAAPPTFNGPRSSV